MVLSTPQESYDPEHATNLLKDGNEETVQQATKNLLSRQVVAKLVRDVTKQKPGRQLKISEVNQNALGGSIGREVFMDAATLEEDSSQHIDWREWPLLSSDGDTAALINLTSLGKVDFKIDVTQAIAACAPLDWNSKKAGMHFFRRSCGCLTINTR